MKPQLRPIHLGNTLLPSVGIGYHYGIAYARYTNQDILQVSMLGRPILVLYQVYQFFRKGIVLHTHFITVKIQRIVLIM